MIDPAADTDGLFFQQTEIRGGLPGIQDPGLILLQTVDILTSEGSDPAHTLHTVEDQSFTLQDRMHAGLCFEGLFPVMHWVSILLEWPENGGWLFYFEDLFGYLHSGENARLLYFQDSLTPGFGRNTGQSSMIAVPDILLQGGQYQLLQLFIKS